MVEVVEVSRTTRGNTNPGVVFELRLNFSREVDFGTNLAPLLLNLTRYAAPPTSSRDSGSLGGRRRNQHL